MEKNVQFDFLKRRLKHMHFLDPLLSFKTLSFIKNGCLVLYIYGTS